MDREDAGRGQPDSERDLSFRGQEEVAQHLKGGARCRGESDLDYHILTASCGDRELAAILGYEASCWSDVLIPSARPESVWEEYDS